MSDLVGHHIVGFPTRRLKCNNSKFVMQEMLLSNIRTKMTVFKVKNDISEYTSGIHFPTLMTIFSSPEPKAHKVSL